MSNHFTLLATRYAKAVVKDGFAPPRDAGSKPRPCGELEIAACRRFLDDIEWQSDDDFEYEYYAPSAEHYCEFIEMMPHPKGKWGRRITGVQDGLIDLEAWQAFIVCNIFGWFHKVTGARRFREVYFEVARKNAKTTIMTCIAIAMAVADGEYAPEVYLGATSERQAKIAFKMATQMCKKAEKYDGFMTEFGVQAFIEKIDLPDQGIIEPLPANPGDGSSPSFAGIDEFHEHKNDRLVNAMETGMGSRDNPLMFHITTAGTNYAGPCWEYRQRIVKMLRGAIDSPSVFGIIFCPDKDDDWKVFENWKKANPNYGVSVSETYLRGMLSTAIESNRKRNSILTKNFNTWRHALDAYFDISAWSEGSIELTQDITDAELLNCKASVALDCAYKNDLVSVTTLFEIERDDGKYYFVRQMFFLPEDTVKLEENKHYQDYHAKGEITVTPGGITDFAAVKEYIIGECRTYDVETVYYDQYGAVQLATELAAHEDFEIDVCEFLQRAKYTTEPMRWTEALIKDGKVRHEGSQCMTWCLGNVVAKDFADKGVIPRKESAEKKIDGAVTLIMAMTHFCSGEEEDGNWYEDNDLVMIG